MTKVSVIIPTYNRKEYVQETIQSIFSQSYSDYEVIVVDDGSQDGTGEVLSRRFGDRIRYIWQANQGESAARNHGLELARGEFIALLDSDDLWLPEKLARQVPVLEADGSAGMVFSQAWLIDGSGNRIDYRPARSNLKVMDLDVERLFLQNVIAGPSTTLIRKEVFDQIGGFSNDIQYGEDWDLWLRLGLRYRIRFIPEPLALVRRHRNSQCYYPSPERNARRLADHLTTLERAFSAQPGASLELKNRALANQYLEAFLTEVAVGNQEAARGNLQAVRELAPELLSDSKVFGKLVVNNAAVAAEEPDGTGLDRGVLYARKVFEHLRAVGIADKPFTKSVLANVYATLGYMADRMGQNQPARDYFLKAVWNDPEWLRNRGVLAILLRAILPKEIFSRFRKSESRAA